MPAEQIGWLRSTLSAQLEKGMELLPSEANLLADAARQLIPAQPSGRLSELNKEWKDGKFQSGYIRGGPAIGDPKRRTERLPPPTASRVVTSEDRPWRGGRPGSLPELRKPPKKDRHPRTPEPDHKPKINTRVSRARAKYLSSSGRGLPTGPSAADGPSRRPPATPAYSDGSGVDVLTGDDWEEPAPRRKTMPVTLPLSQSWAEDEDRPPLHPIFEYGDGSNGQVWPATELPAGREALELSLQLAGKTQEYGKSGARNHRLRQSQSFSGEEQQNIPPNEAHRFIRYGLAATSASRQWASALNAAADDPGARWASGMVTGPGQTHGVHGSVAAGIWVE